MPEPKRPDYLIYGVDDKPPWPVVIGLGLQHVAVMCPYLVLVAVVASKSGIDHAEIASVMGLSMIAMAIMTILQSLKKGPVGSGYLCPPVVSAIYLSAALIAADRGGIALVCGMLIFAGLVETAFGFIGTKLRKLFPPVVSGIIITAVGLDLGLIGAREFLDVDQESSTLTKQHLFTAFVTLATMVGLSVWGKGLLRLFCSFIGIVVGFTLAATFGLIPADSIQILKAAPIVGVPDYQILNYSFDPSLMIPFAICAAAAGLRAIGVVTTSQKMTNADWKRPDRDSIRKGVFADGIGCAIGGALAAPGLSAGPSLVGMQKATGASSRIIAVAIAGWLILLALIPRFAALIQIMPDSVIGGALVFTGSFMVVAGIEIIASRPVDMRTTFIVGVSLLAAMSRSVYAHFYENVSAWLVPLTDTVIAMAVETAFVLNLVFLIGRRRKTNLVLGAAESTHADSILDQLESQATQWKVTNETAQSAAESLRDLIELLESGNHVDGDLKIEASYDDYDFIMTLRYKGHLPAIASQTRLKGDLLEEQGFTVGLSGFLSGVYPDRLERSAKGEDCIIKLAFET
ncbi:MAG: solute carrier family 23 protein [Verrucomicrobiota bacterium]